LVTVVDSITFQLPINQLPISGARGHGDGGRGGGGGRLTTHLARLGVLPLHDLEGNLL